MSKENELVYWSALANLENVSIERINKIAIAVIHNNHMDLCEFFNIDESKAAEVAKLDQKELFAFRNAKKLLSAIENDMQKLIEAGVKLIPLNSPNYPSILKENLKIGKAPTMLYTLGNYQIIDSPASSVAIQRKSSEGSIAFAGNIIRKMAAEGKVFVTGFEYASEQQTLEMALCAGCKALAVLPQGILSFDNSLNRFGSRVSSGDLLLLSRFPPNALYNKEYSNQARIAALGLSEKIFIASVADRGAVWLESVEAIKKGRKVCVRKPAAEEKNANSLLIELGAIPLDKDGNEMAHAHVSLEFFDESHSKASMIKRKFPEKAGLLEQIYELLFRIGNCPISSPEIINKLGLDIVVGSLTSKLKNDPMIEIVSGSPLKFKLRNYKGERTLFD